jgi:hypothetical protein
MRGALPLAIGIADRDSSFYVALVSSSFGPNPAHRPHAARRVCRRM